MKYLPLLVLITVGLGISIVYGHDFSSETVFLSDVDGGNITFALDFTATTYTVAGNQARFTVFEMNNNGTYTRLGFRNPWANATMNITHAGDNYLAFTVTVAGPTVFEVWLPDDGEPDNIAGADADNWAAPSLEVTMNNNGTVVLEWAEAGAPSLFDRIVDDLGLFWTLFPIVLFFAVLDSRRSGLINNKVFIYLMLVAVASIIALLFRILN